MALAPARHPVNTTLTIAAQFTDADYVDVDPATVTFRLHSPTGTVSSYVYGTDAALERDNTGDYHIEVTPDESGRWHYRWESTGDHQTVAIEGMFVVVTSPFYEGRPDAYRK